MQVLIILSVDWIHGPRRILVLVNIAFCYGVTCPVLHVFRYFLLLISIVQLTVQVNALLSFLLQFVQVILIVSIDLPVIKAAHILAVFRIVHPTHVVFLFCFDCLVQGHHLPHVWFLVTWFDQVFMSSLHKSLKPISGHHSISHRRHVWLLSHRRLRGIILPLYTGLRLLRRQHLRTILSLTFHTALHRRRDLGGGVEVRW